MKTPNPGSPEAIELGCKCPILDNGHGNEELDRTRGFWYNMKCPLHCPELPFPKHSDESASEEG